MKAQIKKEPMLYGIIGLLIGLIIAWSVSVYAVNGNRTDMMKMMGMHSNSNMMHDTEICEGLQCSQ